MVCQMQRHPGYQKRRARAIVSGQRSLRSVQTPNCVVIQTYFPRGIYLWVLFVELDAIIGTSGRL